MGDLRTKRTYILLKNALFDLLSKKSFDEIKVNDICETAMVHRTTFYSHFSDKYDLADYCIKDIENELKEKINKKTYSNIQEFYSNLITDLLDYIGNHKELFQNMLKHNYDTDIISIFKNTCTSFIYEMLVKEEKKGISHDIPIECIAKFYSGAVVSSISWWITNKSSDEISQEVFCNYLISLIFNKSYL